ncbi:MAG: cytochrome c [Leptospiraceae bacterium]|nr:cytochrome c [Leptospiraceae bacterium]MDW7975000.1 cytochrome c [Leptospiraceae bacterium]
MKYLTLFAVLPVLWSCNYAGNKSGLHWFLDLHDNYAVESQEEDVTTYLVSYYSAKLKGSDNIESQSGFGSTMRVPPEGTVPRNYMPYLYDPNDFDTPAKELKNPLKPTKQVLERGQKQYNVYCAVCHGATGLGDGPLSPRLANIPALAGDKSNVLDWEDGRFYHIITVGRARMKAYAAQILPEDRWAIIHYIRLLQQNAK